MLPVISHIVNVQYASYPVIYKFFQTKIFFIIILIIIGNFHHFRVGTIPRIPDDKFTKVVVFPSKRCLDYIMQPGKGGVFRYQKDT